MLKKMLFLLLLFGCTQNKNSKNTDQLLSMDNRNPKIYYKDFNLFLLQGIEELKAPSSGDYPLISILKHNQDSMNFAFKLSPTTTLFETQCMKSGDNFICRREAKEDGEYYLYESFHTPEKIIEIYSLIDKDANKPIATIRVSQITKDSVISYTFSRFEQPEVFLLYKDLKNYPTRKAKNKGETILRHKNNNTLEVHSKFIDLKTNNILINETTCYDLKGHSWLWWSYIGHSLEKVACN